MWPFNYFAKRKKEDEAYEKSKAFNALMSAHGKFNKDFTDAKNAGNHTKAVEALRQLHANAAVLKTDHQYEILVIRPSEDLVSMSIEGLDYELQSERHTLETLQRSPHRSMRSWQDMIAHQQGWIQCLRYERASRVS